MYAIDEPSTFHRIGVHWLPYIRSLGVNVSRRKSNEQTSFGLPTFLLRTKCSAIVQFTTHQVPVVLVGNKIDLRGDDVSNKRLEDEVVPLMNDFKVCPPFVMCQ